MLAGGSSAHRRPRSGESMPDLEFGAYAAPPPARTTASGALPLLVALWYGSSCLAITTSKLCMERARVPFVLCACQFGAATLLTKALLVLEDRRKPAAAGGGRAVGAVARVAASYTVGFALTNTAFSLASAPFVETVKALEPVSTAALARLRLGDRESCATYATLAPIVAGVALATGGGVADAGPNRGLALAAVLACNVCFSLRAVFAKELRRDAPARVEIKSSTRLQCERNPTDCAVLFGCASRTRREQSIRPKISRNEWKTAEI